MAGKYANYILFNRAWADIFNDLTDEQLGAVTRDLYRIANGDESEASDPTLKIIVKICGAEILQNNAQYEKKCNQLKENGSKANKKANVTNCNQLQPNALKERKKEGKKERMTEGILSFYSESENSADTAPGGGADRQEEKCGLEGLEDRMKKFR